ncbi:MAG: helix-turn-helix domain-containing protein [Bacteroidota bacterium]
MATFFDDLVRIRKEKKLSRQDVYYTCRIPMEMIEAIEDGSIMSGKVRNKTYIRSYFRTYAKTLGISDEDIITALDEYDAGLYDHGLMHKYLPDQPDDSTPAEKQSSAKPAKEKKKKESRETGDAGNVKEQGAERKGKSKVITPESQEKTVDDVEWEDENIKKTRTTSTSTSPSDYDKEEKRDADAGSAVPAPEPTDVGGVDWASKVKKAVYRPQRNRLLWVILAILLALALALASIVWYWQGYGTEPAPTPAVEQDVPAPTDPESVPEEVPQAGLPADEADPSAVEPAQQDILTVDGSDIEDEVPPEEPPPPPTREEILADIEAHYTTGDTLYALAYALFGNLEPVRVQSDVFAGEDLQDGPPRPYWVEQYQAMRFEFLDEIILQGSLARMVLIINGHIIDNFADFYIDGSRISITRERLIDNGTFEIAEEDPFTVLEVPRSVVDRPRFSP